MKKWIKITVVIVGFLLLLMIILPFIFKGKIVSTIQEQANANLNAKLHFSDVGLDLFRSFPNFSLRLDDFSIEGQGDFKGDTLIKANQIGFTLDLMSVFKGSEIGIRNISLKSPKVFLKVNPDGKANWDITKPAPTVEPQKPAEPSNFKITLKQYSITDAQVEYLDETLNFSTKLQGLNHSGSGDFTADRTTLKTQTTIDSMDLSFDGIQYLRKVNVAYNADFDLDLKNSIYAFLENALRLNDLELKFSGKVMMPSNDIGFDLRWEALKNEVKNFISLVPGAFTQDFKNVKSTGKLALNGFLKGVYNEKTMPGFGLNLLIENGSIQYPSLPKKISNIQTDLRVLCNNGIPDATTIDLRKLHLDFGPFPFDMKAFVKTPVSDPDMDIAVKTNMNLASIKEFVPLEAKTALSGMLNADASFKGKLSSIEREKYAEFEARGNALLSSFLYQSPDLPQDVKIARAAMNFNPQFVELTELNLTIGKSDIQASGKLSNYLAYVFNDELIRGELTLNSNYLDLNPFMVSDSASSTASAAPPAGTDVAGYIRVPANIDFKLNSKINKLIYDNMQLSNVIGTLLVRDETVDLNGLSMQTLGGTIAMSGLYDTRDANGPAVDFMLNMQNLDVRQCATTFNTVKQLAPVAQHATGTISVKDFHFACKSDKAFNPILKTVNGGGRLITSVIEIEGFEMVKRTAEALKLDKLKKWKLEQINAGFVITDGTVTLEPFDTKLAGYPARIGGKTGLDQSIDYAVNVEIPRAEFGGAANSVLNGMVAKANSAGFKGSIGDKVPVAVRVRGTFKDPKVTTDIRQQANDVMNDLKKQAEEKAREELEKRTKELEDRANAEKDRLKKEAEEKLKKEQERLKSEADKAKSEAERRAREEAEKAKRKAEEEAKKGLNNLLKRK